MVLGVLTAPRAGVDYLPGALEQVGGEAGPWGGRRILICDGPLRPAPLPWEVFRAAPPPGTLGSVRAFWRLLEEAGEGPLLLLHDDARCARDFLPYAAAVGIPEGLAAVVYYQAGWEGSLPGLHERVFGAGAFVGVIGTAFSAAAVARLRAWNVRAWPVRHGLDAAVARALGGERFAVHVPHLVQHVGEVGAIERVVRWGPRPSMTFAPEAPDGPIPGFPRYPPKPTPPRGPSFVSRWRR